MTAPGGSWAEAHVDVELRFEDLDTELVRRLERSSQIAQRAVNKNLDKIAGGARRSFEKIGNAYDRQMDRMEKRTTKSVASINRRLKSIDQNTVANVEVKMSGESAKDIRATASALRRLQRDSGNIACRIDITINTMAEIRELDRAIRRLPRRKSINVDVDKKGSARNSLVGLARGAIGAIGTFGKFTAIAGAASLALGAMVPIVGALGAGLVAVGGAAGVAAIGAVAALGAAAATLKTAFSGVGDALSNAFDPEKAEEFEKALEKLTPSAQSAVRAIQGLGKSYADVVKTPVQEAMFSGLGPKIARLQTFMIPLRDSLVNVAQGFNDAANGALRMIETARGTAMVNSLLANSGTVASNFGAAIVGLIPGFLSLGSAASSVLAPMSEGIGGIARQWSESMMRMQETGELQTKMQGLLDTARQFGQVLGQLGSILGGVFSAAKAAGGGNPFAQWIGTLSKISEWVNSFAGQNALTTFFSSAREAVGAVIPVFLQIAQVIGSTVAPIIAKLATTIGPALVPAIHALGEGISSIAPVFELVGQVVATLLQWITPLLPLLVQLAPSILVVVGALMGFMKVIKIVKMLQAAWTALQLAFAMSPIGLLITAVVAVVAALALFFTKTELGRTIITNVWNAIKTAIGAVWDWLSTTVFPALQAAFQLVGQVVMWLWTNVMQPAWAGIQMAISAAWSILQPILSIIGSAFRLIGTVVSWLWTNVMVPAWQGIQMAIAVAWAVISPVIEAIKAAFRAIATVASWLYNEVIKPVWDWIGRKIDDTKIVIGFAIGIIKDHFQAFADKVGEVKDWITGKWDDMVRGFGIMKDKIGDGIGAIKDFFTGLWNKVKEIVDRIVSAVKSMGDKVKSVASTLTFGLVSRNAAGGPVVGLAAGGGIRALAGGGRVGGGATTPIRPGGFIVNAKQTAKNKALLKALVPSGRVLSGPGTGTSDSITGIHDGKPVAKVSRGEFYAPPTAAKRMLPQLVAINAGKQFAKVARAIGGRLPAFAPGGMVPSALRDKARQAVQSGYVWGGWGRGWNTDCSGLTSSLANMATGKSSGPGEGERTATGGMRPFLEARAFKDGPGPDGSLRIGWSDTHANAQLPTGENIEHTGPEGAPAKFGADAKGPDSMPNEMHLPMGGDTDSGGLGTGLETGSGGLGGSSSTPIGSGIGSSGSSPSWGNSGGGSKANSAVDAERQGLTPVWVENWPVTMGGGGGLSTSTSTTGDLSTTGGAATDGDLSTAGTTPTLSASSSKKDVAAAIYAKARKRGYSHEEALAIVSTAIQESNLDANASGGGGAWHGYFQQDSSYANRDDPNGNVDGFLDRLDEKTKSDPNSDIWKRIFWLQQRPGESTADAAVANGRQAYLDEIKSRQGEANDLVGQVPVTPQGNVPVDVQATPPTTDSTPDAGISPSDPSTTATTTAAATADKPKSESMPYGKARADQWLSEQNLGSSLQDIGVSGLKETFGEFGALIGVDSFVERGIDEMVTYLKQIAEKNPKAEFKWADVVNINGANPEQTKSKTTEGMTAVMDTYRQG